MAARARLSGWFSRAWSPAGATTTARYGFSRKPCWSAPVRTICVARTGVHAWVQPAWKLSRETSRSARLSALVKQPSEASSGVRTLGESDSAKAVVQTLSKPRAYDRTISVFFWKKLVPALTAKDWEDRKS